MHSHYGLQEQQDNSARLIIWMPEERTKADQQVVVMLSDFSFTPHEPVLKTLKSGRPVPVPNMKKNRSGEKSQSSNSEKMSASMGKSAAAEVIAQKWDDQKQRLVRTVLRAPEAEIDVKYDALIA